jgi:hypothetical protein
MRSGVIAWLAWLACRQRHSFRVFWFQRRAHPMGFESRPNMASGRQAQPNVLNLNQSPNLTNTLP